MKRKPVSSPLSSFSHPKMSEGYYSSGPNPNLRRYVEEHATPYDPERDDYDVRPFDQPIMTTKATAIYSMHSYHQGKKPHDAMRPPADDEERAQKEALRTGGTLRRIKRFARALSEGVPPHDRDRPANVATAADWIRQCRRAGLYEKGGFDFGQLDEIGAMEVAEDCQVCVRRSG